MNYIKHKAFHFAKQNKINRKEITLPLLRITARQNGYIVKNYSDNKTIMIMLGVFDEAKQAASVSTRDGNGNVIIFIDDLMPKDKQLFALAHEIGHIQLEHSNRTPKSVQEDEANKFAHYLLNSNKRKFDWSILEIVPLTAILCVACILLSSILTKEPKSLPAATTTLSSSYTYSQEHDISATYYWTESGKVYHLYRDCQSLKNSKNILSGTYAEASVEKERLCKFCERRK